jgi:Putative peptidoglycan binding domain
VPPGSYPACVRTRRLLAVALAGVLGIGAGTVTALLLPTSSTTASFADPLHLGIPLRNQQCTGDNLILLAWGDRGVALGSAAASNPDAHYLDTTKSCDTRWVNPDSPDRYAAYLGPYPTGQAACAVRMTVQYKGDYVTHLVPGNTKFVQCACFTAPSAIPVLSATMQVTVLAGMWTRSLQQMLLDSHYLPVRHDTGIFDPATLAAVKRLQADRALPQNGVMDSDAWSQLLQTTCPLYTS